MQVEEGAGVHNAWQCAVLSVMLLPPCIAEPASGMCPEIISHVRDVRAAITSRPDHESLLHFLRSSPDRW